MVCGALGLVVSSIVGRVVALAHVVASAPSTEYAGTNSVVEGLA